MLAGSSLPCIPEKNSRRRTWQFRRIHHDTLALLNAIHTSCSIHSGCLKIIILLDITDKFNSLTFETKITQRALSNFCIRRSSLVLVVVPFSWMFSLARAFWAGGGLALSLTSLSIRVCLFATCPAVDCFSCALVKKNNNGLLCACFANTKYRIHQTFAVHHARVEIRVVCACFLCPFVPLLFPKLYGTPLRCPPFTGPLPSWSDESSLTLIITRKLQAFLFLCRRLMSGSGDVNVRSSN